MENWVEGVGSKRVRMEVGLYRFKARMCIQTSYRPTSATFKMYVFSSINFPGYLLSCGSWHINNR